MPSHHGSNKRANQLKKPNLQQILIDFLIITDSFPILLTTKPHFYYVDRNGYNQIWRFYMKNMSRLRLLMTCLALPISTFSADEGSPVDVTAALFTPSLPPIDYAKPDDFIFLGTAGDVDLSEDQGSLTLAQSYLSLPLNKYEFSFSMYVKPNDGNPYRRIVRKLSVSNQESYKELRKKLSLAFNILPKYIALISEGKLVDLNSNEPVDLQILLNLSDYGDESIPLFTLPYSE